MDTSVVSQGVTRRLSLTGNMSLTGVLKDRWLVGMKSSEFFFSLHRNSPAKQCFLFTLHYDEELAGAHVAGAPIS